MNKTLCIDFGNSKTKVSVFTEKGPIIVPDKFGENAFATVVAFMSDGTLKIGEPAKSQLLNNPLNTITSLKRFLGVNNKNKRKLQKYCSNNFVFDDNDFVSFKIGENHITSEDVIVLIFKEIKKDAEAFLNQTIKDVILTVPSNFLYNERLLIISACRKAGLSVKRLLTEQSSAAIAYGNKILAEDKKIMIFDFGSGKIDISILEFTPGLYEVLATSGNNYLGGDDLDYKILDYLVENFYLNEGIDLSNDPIALARLKLAAEIAKQELSSYLFSEINLPFIYNADGNHKHLVTKITRELFENLISDIISEIVIICSEILRKSKLNSKDIDEILLVGGSSRIPIIQQVLKNLFGNASLKNVFADETIAIGAAIQSGMLEGKVKESVIVDVVPYPIGVELKGGQFYKIVESNSIFPLNKSIKVTTVRNLQNSIYVNILEENIENSNKFVRLGSLKLVGILPAAMGATEIDLKIDIDKNGIIHVLVIDIESNIRILKTIDTIQDNFQNSKEYAINLFNEADKNSTLESKQFIDDDAQPIERAPYLYTINGIGTKIYDDTLYFVFIFIPLFAISRYSIEKQSENLFRFYGKLNLHNWQIIWNCFISIIFFIFFMLILI